MQSAPSVPAVPAYFTVHAAGSACSACGSTAAPARPRAAQAVFFAALAGLVVFLALVPALGFALFMVSPIVAVAGLGISPLARAAFPRPTCPDCGRHRA